jgi:RHS repeat-associated protein
LDCTCPQAPNFPYNGAVLESYEFRRFQTSANPFWSPLRFPGQYFDSETDLFENWNRYYDSAAGRYLQPEPMLQDPKWVADKAKEGMSTPAYSYANNNPLHFIDPAGLQTCPPGSSCEGCTLTSVGGEECWVCPAGKSPRGGMPLCPNRCAAVKTMCIEECLHELPTNDRCSQSAPFLKCVAECMVKNGCNG